MTKILYAALALTTLAGSAVAAPVTPSPRAAVRTDVARQVARSSVLDERMGQLQLDLLVADVLNERGRAKPEPRAELSMLTLRR